MTSSKSAADKPPVKATSARGTPQKYSASPNAEQFSGRALVAKPLHGSTASSRAKQNQPSGTTGKGLLVEKKVSKRVSPNASSNSVSSLKASEPAVASGKTSTSQPTAANDSQYRVDTKKTHHSDVNPGPEPGLGSGSTSTPSSSSATPSAKSSVRYAC